MTCPRCNVTADQVLTVQGVHVCSACGMAVVDTDDGAWRNAVYADVADLTAAEMQQLRIASAPLMRPKR